MIGSEPQRLGLLRLRQRADFVEHRPGNSPSTTTCPPPTQSI